MNRYRSFIRKTNFFYYILLGMIMFQSCEKDPTVTISSLAEPGVHDVRVKVDTMERWFKAIVPSGYDHAKQHPILLAYHGGGLSMGFMFNNRKDLIQRCEKENWILVFPNGANFDDNKGAATWNAIHCCDPARKFNIDDIGFTRKIVDTLTTDLSLDLNRVYAIGGSNGGFFVHRIAEELPDIFAAVAENQGVAGGSPDSLSEIILAEPTQPIPFILIHGMSDMKVKFHGGVTIDFPRYDIPFSESVGIWATNNGCENMPDTTVVEGLEGKVWIVDFDNCIDNFDIRAIAIENKGHGWPGLEESGFDGTNASVDFLKKYTKQ